MKEFTKWWKDNHYTHYNDRACKVGWKAALEWVANKCRGRRSKKLYDLLGEIDGELLSE